MRLVLRAALVAATLSIPSWMNSAFARDTPRRLFDSDAVINLTIAGPIGYMSRSITAKPVSGLLKVEGDAPEALPISLSVRGAVRRMPETCSFPPLRVIFTTKPASSSIFKGQSELKLVTHCQPSEKYQQYVLLEYAAYRLYSALTPESFDVRLAKINYVNENGQPIASRYGFFIEDIDDVAKRNGQKRFHANRISIGQLDPVTSARFAVFQYMISNLDWSMTTNAPGEGCCHNSRLIGAKGTSTGLITVPYDFDYSGLVNTPYALPPENVSVANVRVRRYRGYCRYNEQAQAIVASISARRASLLNIVDKIPELNDNSREQSASYLGAFFDQIASPSQVTEVLKTCLG